MARIRTIKPEFAQSESMGRISREARLCFVLLWTIADDDGRLRGNSRMLASLLYPYDTDAPERIDAWLGELEAEGCVRRYQAGTSTYLEINHWREHQRIDKPTKSRLPPFNEGSPVPRDNSESPREDSRALQVGREGNGVEGNGVEGNGVEGNGVEATGEKPSRVLATPLPPRSTRKTRLPADFGISDRVRKWAAEKGHRQLDLHLETFRSKCIQKGYTNVDWDEAFMGAIRENWAKVPPPPNVAGEDFKVAV